MDSRLRSSYLCMTFFGATNFVANISEPRDPIPGTLWPKFWRHVTQFLVACDPIPGDMRPKVVHFVVHFVRIFFFFGRDPICAPIFWTT